MCSKKLSKISKSKIFCCSVIFLVGVVTETIVAKEKYVFGVVPQQAASKIARTWQPVLNYLERQTGYKFRFATAKNIPVFEKNLAQGVYDFAYMNPYHYVVFHKHTGYLALAKAHGKKIHGIMVVHKDSKVNSLNDLQNKELAFPSPQAFAASMITRSELSRKKISFVPKYVSSHDSVYRNVANNNFIAGGGVIRTFKATSEDIRNKLRILYKTRGYTPHAFAVHPSVPAKVRRSVLKVMIKMEKTIEGKKLLNSLKIKGIGRAKDSDWDDVRKIEY